MPVSGQPPAQSIPTIWFGMRCDFTRAALAGALAAGGVDPVAVVLPRGPRPLGAGWPAPPFDRWLRELDVEVVEVDRLAGDDLATVLRVIRERGIALGVGACFPWRVPAALREALPAAALNIHPSLLPALRGPEPVFHAYRLGLPATGVTVHLMDAGWDTGPVLAQEGQAIPDSGRAEAFEAALAGHGGRLLAEVAPAWVAGTLSLVPQDDARATWAPVPSADDRTILENMTVSQVTRWLEACGPLLARNVAGDLAAVMAAVEEKSRSDADLRSDRSIVRIPCRDGVLWAR